MAAPLFLAAGLDPGAVNIRIINDPSLNAFVAGGQRIFINTGLLIASDNANQVIGVIAHETGHITGGHLARTRDALSEASAQASEHKFSLNFCFMSGSRSLMPGNCNPGKIIEMFCDWVARRE